VEGYEVKANDGHHVGHVQRVAGGVLVIEHGALKHRIAVPHELAHVDDDARLVRLTVSDDLLHDAPRVHHDHIDAAAVAAYYGYDEPTDSPSSA
jgi:hypothetical protein